MTPDYIKSEYQKLRNFLGKKPSSKEFYDNTSIKEHNVVKLFRSYSNLVSLMGDIPEKFGSEGRTFDEFMTAYGTAVRKLKKLPTVGDWSYNGFQPTTGSFHGQLKIKWSEMPMRFYNYAINKSEWGDVLELLPANVKVKINPFTKSKTPEIADPTVEYVYLMKSGKYYTIGKTNHVGRRSYENGKKLPEKTLIIHSIETDDAYGIEQYWHKRFSDKRLEGEWFNLNDEDVKIFKRRKFM